MTGAFRRRGISTEGRPYEDTENGQAKEKENLQAKERGL